jgi:hypothetical protein
MVPALDGRVASAIQVSPLATADRWLRPDWKDRISFSPRDHATLGNCLGNGCEPASEPRLYFPGIKQPMAMLIPIIDKIINETIWLPLNFLAGWITFAILIYLY